MSESQARPRTRSGRATGLALATRWLGVGLGSLVAVVTVSLALTGRIGLFINPDAAWWAVSMSVVLLVGAIGSFTIRVDETHDHEHEDDHEDEPAAPADSDHPALAAVADRVEHSDQPPPARRPLAVAVAVAGGTIATVIAVLGLVLPPQSLSTELALSRSTGAAPLFGGTTTLTLASSADTSGFGIGQWSAALAASTDPTAFIGQPATLVGFVGPGDGDSFELTRLVITHCVIDAQTASVPVSDPDTTTLAVGQWVEVAGAWKREDGGLVFDPVSVSPIDEPEDPYEY